MGKILKLPKQTVPQQGHGNVQLDFVLHWLRTYQKPIMISVILVGLTVTLGFWQKNRLNTRETAALTSLGKIRTEMIGSKESQQNMFPLLNQDQENKKQVIAGLKTIQTQYRGTRAAALSTFYLEHLFNSSGEACSNNQASLRWAGNKYSGTFLEGLSVYAQGFCALNQGDKDQALFLWQRAGDMAEFPMEADSLYQSALLLKSQGMDEEADKLFSDISTRYPNSPYTQWIP